MEQAARLYPRLSREDAYWYNYLWLSYEAGRYYVYPPAGMVDARRGRISRSVNVEDDKGRRQRTEWIGGGCFLVAHQRESSAAFDVRRSLSYPIEICGPVIQQYVGTIAGATVDRAIQAEVEAGASDADGRGTSLAVSAREWLRGALVYGEFNVVTDNSPDGQPYSWGCPPQHLLHWRNGEHGGLEAALVVEGEDEPEFTPTADRRAQRTVRVREWTASEWRLWRCRPDYSDARVIESGPGFGFVPVVPIRYRDGRSLIAGLADIQHEIYNTLSWLQSMHRDQGFPVLTVPQEMGTGTIRNDRQIELSTARAIGYSASAGQPSWISPPTDQCVEMREHMGWLALRAREQAGVARRQDSAQAASGTSEEWRHVEYHALAAEGAEMMSAAETAVGRQRLALARGTTPDQIPLDDVRVSYSTDYAPEDPQRLAETLEAVLALRLGGKPELAAKRAFVSKFFAAAPEAERREMVSDMESRSALESEAQTALDRQIVANANAPRPVAPMPFGAPRSARPRVGP